MLCPNCGAENPDSASYCNLCMARFATGAPLTPAPSPRAPQEPPSQPPDGYDPYTAAPSYVYENDMHMGRKKRNPLRSAKSGVGKVIVLVIVIAVLGAAAFGIFALYGKLTHRDITGSYYFKTDPRYYATFNKDGTCFIVQLDGSASGRYELNGNQMTLIPDDQKRWTGDVFTVKGDTMYDR